MLNRLSIQNVALIESAELVFSAGLNVLSGETGAGKSVILDCIDFILGAKADREMIRTGETECRVTAEFSNADKVAPILNEFDIDCDETLVIARKLSADGKSALRINGCSVTASMLRRVTQQLVDVHGQSEHFSLLKESNQLNLLDEVAGEKVAAIKNRLSQALSLRRRILQEISLLGGDESERERKLDILKFQIGEIDKSCPKEGEEEELSARLARYRNAERILLGLSGVRECLLSDGGSSDSLNSARRYINQLSRYDAQYAELEERLENVIAEVADIGDTVESLADELNLDEREAERMDARLEEIKSLKKKYGNSVAEIRTFRERIGEEYSALSESGTRLHRLTGELERVEDEIFDACESLAAERKVAAKDFCKRVTDELKTLNISSAKFEIRLGSFTREDLPHATAEGLGSVEYLFSANAGEPLKPLGKIISGGEMSRFMLAVKTQMREGEGVGTYIFDEIDAGISGKTARVVAEKFMTIARRAQIIAVTHSAQIAAAAETSYLIEKHEESGRSRTEITEIDGEARVREIARLVGEADSSFARGHAVELLENAEKFRSSL